jgi:hypothetical protein
MSVATVVARENRLADLARSVEGSSRTAAIACTGVCVLLLIAPFEASRPLLHLPGQSLSSVEVGLSVVLLAWAASHVRTRIIPRWRTSLTWPWLAWIAMALVAAVAAPDNRANAFHMAGRLALAFVVFLVTVGGITTLRRVRIALTTGVLAGVVVSAIVIAEYVALPGIFEFLRTFRTDVAVVGAQVRAGGPFPYPTIASMYLEVLFAFGLGVLAVAVDDGRNRTAVALILALSLIAEAIILTFTRAGLITMVVSVAVVGTVRVMRSRFDRGAQAIAFVAIVVGVQVGASRSFEAMGLRLTTEGQDAWYRAGFGVPAQLTIGTGETLAVPITVTNMGRLTWDPSGARSFQLSYHWLLPHEDRVVSWEGNRTAFPTAVRPGESVTLEALVEAPRQPGQYRLMWDVEQVNQLWFSTEPDARLAVTGATVTGPLRESIHLAGLRPLPRPSRRPGRLVLWRAAVGMIAAHPLTGVGPDNYRLQYGRYSGIANADPRVHSNNMYLEVLAGCGIVGGLAFAWLYWRALRLIAGAVRASIDLRMATFAAAVCAAAAAIALHGLVDSFLSFTATYTLIAITLALAVACGDLNGRHANRI